MSQNASSSLSMPGSSTPESEHGRSPSSAPNLWRGLCPRLPGADCARWTAGGGSARCNWPTSTRKWKSRPDSSANQRTGRESISPTSSSPPRKTTRPIRSAREYREWTWDLYGRVSGRGEYSVSNESSPFDVDEAVDLPYPFLTKSPTVIGGDLVARGRVLAGLGTTGVDLNPPARLIEFGPGWGNLTGDLLATGFAVTAVEVEPRFCELLRRRYPDRARMSIVEADMLSFSTAEPAHAAVFFESFHHCADHLAMLENLHRMVLPGGFVLFAGEPVQDLAYPWGPRLDGISLWSMRTYGWLELGFDRKYFRRALSLTRWHLVPVAFPATDDELLVARAQG